MKTLIVGAGSIGQKEITELNKHPDINISGVVEKNDDRRDAISEKVPNTYKDLSQALEDTETDLVRIATPPQTHYEQAKMALNAGKDVYIEKIMTIESEKAGEIVNLAENLNQSVYVRRNAIYTPVYQRTMEKKSEIGDLRHVHWIEPIEEYSYWSKGKQKWLKNLPGGIVSEHLPHALYTVRWFLGEEPSVENVRYKEDEIHISLKAGEKTAEISFVKNCDLPMLLNLVGSEGYLSVDHSTMRIKNPRGFEDSSSVEMRTIKANLHEFKGNIKNVLRLASKFFRRELKINPDPMYSKSDNYRQFTDIAEGGETSGNFSIDGKEGLKNVKLFEEIWEEAGEIKK